MLQAVLAEKRGLQQPLRGNAQKKGAAKGKTLAVPVSKALRGGQGAGRRGRGGRGGSTGGRSQQGEKFWNPASLKITIKNDKVQYPIIKVSVVARTRQHRPQARIFYSSACSVL